MWYFIWGFTVCHRTHLGITSIKRVIMALEGGDLFAGQTGDVFTQTGV